jgi:hypothetical protein
MTRFHLGAQERRLSGRVRLADGQKPLNFPEQLARLSGVNNGI